MPSGQTAITCRNNNPIRRSRIRYCFHQEKTPDENDQKTNDNTLPQLKKGEQDASVSHRRTFLNIDT
jgi:hypothetical protein